MKLYILFIILNLMLATRSHAQPNYALFEQLFDSSDLVVQGVIVSKDCHFNELGVLDCSYSVKIDSIYKGEILSYDFQLQNHGFRDSSDKKIILFQKDCLLYLDNTGNVNSNQHFKDICYESNDNLIIFLKRIQRIDPQTKLEHFYFKLTDSWLGIQPANSYMAIDLRNFIKFEFLRKTKK